MPETLFGSKLKPGSSNVNFFYYVYWSSYTSDSNIISLQGFQYWVCWKSTNIK